MTKQRIVIKVGSAILTQNGKLAIDRMSNLVKFIVELKKYNYEIILVSSGAVAAGFTLISLDKNEISNKQALASIGQPLLLNKYQNEFSKYNQLCSQVLLEASIFNDTKRLTYAKDTINTLLKNNVVPIINENDVTAIDELVFGDNDQLSAHIANHFNSNMLIILTDIDGYYDKNPHQYKNAILQKHISHIDEHLLNQKSNAHNEFATGGIVTKLKAAKYLIENNKKMFLSSGFNLNVAYDFLINNKHTGGTLFCKNKQ